MKKWYLVAFILAAVLLAVGCTPTARVMIPEAATSEIYALSGSEGIEKYLEVKDIQNREDFCYIMVFIKSLPGEFTTLEDAFPQVNALTRTFLESTVEILSRYNFNKDVHVWVQLPLKEGGVTVLGHAEYDGRNFHDFELLKP
ncbi:hypothetical protein ACFLSK_01265 [Chloroflexota bacterium]